MSLPSFLDFTRPGKGVESEEQVPALILFFTRYGRHFMKLLYANLLCAIVLLPMLVWLTGIVNIITIQNAGGVISVLGSLLLAIVVDWPQWILIPLVILSVLLSGPVKAALTGCVLNCAWGIPGLFWSNFAASFRENWKQALITGIFDTVLIFSTIYYLIDGKEVFGAYFHYLLFAWIFFLFLYLLARVYLYPVMVTVELSFLDLVKNCFILSLLQIWRPLLVLAITAVLLLGCLWADILIIPCFLFSFSSYTAAFLARPMIEKYLIPNDENPEENGDGQR